MIWQHVSRTCIGLFSIFVIAALPATAPGQSTNGTRGLSKDAFISDLISQMTVPDMVLQLFLMFGDNIVGPNSNNALYNSTLALAPGSPIGVVHDWYPLNKSRHNDLQRLNLESSHLQIPFMHTGECLHGVGSFQQSMFPQAIGLSASWDTDLVHRVGSAIASEARSIGIHACFAPVLDVCQDPRWGRCQEDWGEDYVHTTYMGTAFASGLSQNSSWDRQDAVIPVMKHFAAHGAPQGGLNTAPFMGHGNREVLMRLLVPFKAAFELGGARGVMMAYSEFDDVPSSVNPIFYDALKEWGYDGFITGDDGGISQLQYTYTISNSPADTLMQWFNAGGMISYYDYPFDVFLNSTVDLVKNGSVELPTLQHKMRELLGVKWDLGLFKDPYISEDINPYELVADHAPLTLEAARKSIVLLENKGSTLPFNLKGDDLSKIALIGPYSDILNYGDYSGTFGAYPIANSTTIRQGMLDSMNMAGSVIELVSSWGANDWLYNAQYPIPGYHFSTNGTTGGMKATYFADTNFSVPMVHTVEMPVRDWGLYPPPGLPSNNFSAVWEGTLNVPVDIETDGWLGVAIDYNSTAKVYVDGRLLVHVPLTTAGNILSNIEPLAYSLVNSTSPPPGSAPFTFKPRAKHIIRLEFVSYNLYQKIENESSLNAEVLLFWNLVDRHSPVQKAIDVARDADAIVLALGANWNSDGENGDRATMGLSPNQTLLTDAILNLNKPVVLLLEGGRPFAIPDFYNRSSAVLYSYFSGQSGGQAIADVLFGAFNPGGRLPLSVPRSSGQLPTYYNYKSTAHVATYADINSAPCYPFGYGISYTNFSMSHFSADVNSPTINTTARVRSESTSASGINTFGAGDTITFTLTVKNTGAMAGSTVPQVYLLQRVSTISQPVKQLVASQRVYLDAGESMSVNMEVGVDRYLKILNRRYEWEVEKGDYTFALLDNGGWFADQGLNVTMQCTGS